MINKEDFIIGGEFWYSNPILNYKFTLLNSINYYFGKVKIIKKDNFLLLKNINSPESNNINMIGWSHYIRYYLKDTQLSKLFYTEQEAIENWNNKIEDYKLKLNNILDLKIKNENESYYSFLRFKNYIINFKENLENLNKVEPLIEFENLNKFSIYYRFTFLYYNRISNVNKSKTTFFNFAFLKLKEETDKSFIFNSYVIDENYSLFTIDDIIDYNNKNNKVGTLVLYKNNIKNQIMFLNLFTGISNIFLSSIERKFFNFIKNINTYFNDISNYLINLKK